MMPLISRAWHASFAHKALVKKAVAERGWNPLNCCLLLHPEILKTKPKNTIANTAHPIENNNNNNNDQVAIPAINTTQGFATVVVDSLIHQRLLEEGCEWRSALMAEGTRIQDELASGRRLTSGLLVSNDMHLLGDHVRDMVQQKETDCQEKEKAKKQKEHDELLKWI